MMISRTCVLLWLYYPRIHSSSPSSGDMLMPRLATTRLQETIRRGHHIEHFLVAQQPSAVFWKILGALNTCQVPVGN